MTDTNQYFIILLAAHCVNGQQISRRGYVLESVRFGGQDLNCEEVREREMRNFYKRPNDQINCTSHFIAW